MQTQCLSLVAAKRTPEQELRWIAADLANNQDKAEKAIARQLQQAVALEHRYEPWKSL